MPLVPDDREWNFYRHFDKGNFLFIDGAVGGYASGELTYSHLSWQSW